MKAFRITLAALAAVAVAAPAAVASPLPVEGGSSDWATPHAHVTGSAASHFTTASVAAMGARGEAAAAFYQSKTKANAAATGVVSRPRPSGAADTPGTSGAALADLYGYDDAVPTAAQLSDDAADAARSAREVMDDLGDCGRVPALAAAVDAKLAQAASRAASGEMLDPPSAAELAVLRLLASDLSTREIGGELFLSPNTVRTHTRALYRKLAVNSRADAVARADLLGFLARTEIT